MGVLSSRSNSIEMIFCTVAGRLLKTMTRSAMLTASEMSWVTSMAVFFFLFDDLSNIVAYRKPGLIIQGGEGLVKEEKLRIKSKGADQSRSLAHASGKLGWP